MLSASGGLNELYDQLDTVLVDEDLDDVITVLITTLAECLAQASDYSPNREIMMDAGNSLVMQYTELCFHNGSVTIN